MKKFKIGIDAYSLKPLGLDPFELLDWALINEAEGVQFSETPPEADDKAFLNELAQYAAENSLYLEWGGGEHIPVDVSTGRAKDIAASNRKAVEQAAAMGIRTVRSCSGGLMRWRDDGPSTETFLHEMAAGLRSQRPVFTDHGVVLAIETHFEFTTFELLRLFEMCEADPGDFLGVCLDTMNVLTMLEDPVAAARRLLPWIVTTHIKDGAVFLTRDGLVSFPAEAGRGLVDFRTIFEALSALPNEVRLSIEDHGGDFLLPIYDPAFLSRFPDLTVPELGGLLKMAADAQVLLQKKELTVVDRSRWPEICEARVKRDLRAVRRIVEEG